MTWSGVVTRALGWLLLTFALLGTTALPAFAARSQPGRGSGGPRAATATGNDISYPQCGGTFPSGQAFGIVAVNGGLANNVNPCLGPSSASYASSELYWAVATSTGATAQPKASLYVNTADPGNVYGGSPVSDWPTSGSTPYGACTTTNVATSTGVATLGANSPACAWEYGFQRANRDVAWLASAADAVNTMAPPVSVPREAGSYPWWLDVETGNTWQSGSSGQSMNVAVLQGMVAALQQAGASRIGVYSTSLQWNQITGGTVSASDSLYQLPTWIPGARNESSARANCGLTSFTGGAVVMTQWFGRPFDGDYACSA